MPRRIALLLVLPALMISPPRAAEAEPHPFNVRDLIAMDRLSEPVASPDGRHLALTISALDLDANRRRSDIWVMRTDGTDLRRLTDDPANDTSPAWHRDGRRVFFLSARSGSTQVWQAGIETGSASQVTTLPIDVGAFKLSPDGTSVIVSADVFVDCDTVACTSERLAAKEKTKASGQIYDQLFVRHWDAWADRRRAHLFVVPVAGGTPVDLMKGMDADAPSKPFGGSEEFTFTPDGSAVVFTARDAGREEAWSTNLDIFVAPVDGSTKPKNLTAANRATDTTPSFSPDGRWLAYTSMERPTFEADRLRIVIRGWPDGPERVLTPDWDRSAAEIAWSADNRTIYATADNLGNKSLFAVDVATGAVRTMVKEGHIAAPVALADRVLFLLDQLRSPAEIYSVRPDGSDTRPVTTVNRERVSAVKLGEPEQFSFKGANGDTVYGWV